MNCDELQQLTAAAALGALDAAEAGLLHARLELDAPARAELTRFLDVTAACVAAGATRRPPPSVRAKVLARIRQTSQLPREYGAPSGAPAVTSSDGLAALPPPVSSEGIQFIGTDSPWLLAPLPGARFKMLSAGPHQAHAILLLELQAGATYPEHDHLGTEDMYVLTGDLQSEGRSLGPGDFLHAEPGSHHQELRSIQGCTALMLVPKAALDGMMPA